MSTPEPPRRESRRRLPRRHPAQTAARVADRLRSQIEDGTHLPGAKLAEQSLAEALDVSRNTLREAFTALDAEGLVRRVPYRGVFVKRPSVEDIAELYRTRRILEPAAALWGELSPSALERMRGIVAEALAARDRSDVPAMAAANEDLHRAIVAMTGAAMLIETMEQVLAQARLVFFTMPDRVQFHASFAVANAALVELLAAGDRQRAAEELRVYLDRAERELLAHVRG